VESPGAARTVGEVRDRFIERLTVALLRLGMYGGELTAQMVLADLCWLDGQDDLRPGVPETLRAARAWSALGVCGVFMEMFRQRRRGARKGGRAGLRGSRSCLGLSEAPSAC
jgi:hypothetical protein